MSLFTADELTAIALSLKVASVAALGSLPFGVALGWLLALGVNRCWGRLKA